MNSATRTFAFAPVFLISALMLTGCSDRGVEQVKVTGKVTLDGGPMPGPGTLFFTPVTRPGTEPLRPGTADFGPDGKYSAGAFEKGDGLIPGTYAVAVHCWKVAATREDRSDAESFIPQKYMDAQESDLELTVERGAGHVTKDFELQSK